jgi:hypothetical protein
MAIVSPGGEVGVYPVHKEYNYFGNSRGANFQGTENIRESTSSFFCICKYSTFTEMLVLLLRCRGVKSEEETELGSKILNTEFDLTPYGGLEMRIFSIRA